MTLFLTESKRDDMLLPYVNLLRERGINTNVSQLKQFLLRKFVNEGLMRNLSLHSNFYLVGVARYYFNGDLTSNKILNVFDETKTDEFIPEICERLNACILILRNAYVDSVGTEFEQPEDFGTLKLNALLRKYNKKINAVLGIETPKKNKEKDEEEVIDYNVGNGYTFDIIYSYEDARKYNKATEPGAWCITYGEHHYNGYIRRLGIHYVIFRQNGYENIARKVGPNWTKRKPHDEYGNSLIALLQSNTTGEPVFITSRWNHGSMNDNTYGCEADHAYTKEEFMNITGVTNDDLQRIFKIWSKNRVVNKKSKGDASKTKKNTQFALRYLKYGQMRMNGGEAFNSVFPDARVYHLTGKENDIKKSIVGLKIPIEIDNNKYFALVLCVKGKMLFETFGFTETDNYWFFRSVFNVSDTTPDADWNSYRFNDLIVVSYPDKYTMYYDIKRNCFINVDGVIKFKYTDRGPSSYSMDECMFFEVALSGNQKALIDWRTNKPLRLPNGECWYEYISSAWFSNRNWRREVDLHVIYRNTDKCLNIVYDSASMEQYFLDLSTKRFFNPKEGIDENENFMISLSGNGINRNSRYYKFLYRKDTGYLADFIRIFKDGKPIAFDGVDHIKDFFELDNNSEQHFAMVTKLDGEKNVFNLNTSEKLNIVDYSGEKIHVEGTFSVGFRDDGNHGLTWIKNLRTFSNNNLLLYNFDEERFYLNPITGGYNFNTENVRYFDANNSIIINPIPNSDILSVYNFYGYKMQHNKKVTIKEIIEYTDQHYSSAGAAPKNINELLQQFFKKNPDMVTLNIIEAIRNYNNNHEEKIDYPELPNYRMAENKLNKKELMYILHETIKRLK